MASAQTAISGVRGTGAADLAPVELDRATTKLARAEAAMNAKRYDEARRLAEEARADAELASAMASAPPVHISPACGSGHEPEENR